MHVRIANWRAGGSRELALVAEVGGVGLVGGKYFGKNGHSGLLVSGFGEGRPDATRIPTTSVNICSVVRARLICSDHYTRFAVATTDDQEMIMDHDRPPLATAAYLAPTDPGDR